MDVYKEWLGIPEGERPPDNYTLLRLVQFEDDAEKIQKNYRKLNAHVRKYSTGQYMQESQDLLNELARAMLCLTDTLRKREYDEGLGREFDDDETEKKPMLEVLVQKKLATTEQVREVASFADSRGLSHRDAVVQMKLASAEEATRAYAQELGRAYVDLSETLPDDSVLDQLPRSVAKRNAIIPLFVDDDVVLVACAYEPSPDLEEDLRMRFGMPVRGLLATPLAVNQSMAKYYAPGMRDDAVSANAAPKSRKAGRAGNAPRPAGGSGGGDGQKFSQLPAEEQKERKQLGIIFMLWSIIGSVLLDQFLVPGGMLLSGWAGISLLPFFLTLFIPPLAIFWVLKIYWK